MKEFNFTMNEVKQNEFQGDIYVEHEKVGYYTGLKFYESNASLYKVWIEKEENRKKGTFSKFFKQVLSLCKERNFNTFILENILDEYMENNKLIKTNNVKYLRNYFTKLEKNNEIESFKFKGEDYMPLYCFIQL